MRGKVIRQSWSSKLKKELPMVIFACSFFFLAGFYGSSLLPRDASRAKARARVLGSVRDKRDYALLPRGETGDDSFVSIPFQVSITVMRLVFISFFPIFYYNVILWTPDELDFFYASIFFYTQACVTMRIHCKSKIRGGFIVIASEDKTGTLDIIEEKIARVMMISREHGEAFIVLRYEIGQKYNSHCDAFDPAQYGPQKSQRVATFLLYLSDVEEGGEIMFPFENGMNMDGTYDFKKCVGLKVKPRQGDGLLFYSLLPNGTIDPTSIHGSCPVIKGEKWVAPKWIRDQVQDD
ncbi:hypothetical protein ACJRO7_019919 [Eucalyptus globulus]|uniref:Fe2OG dioxygenase domain-containing protein n=1 Tax=Eucalyptus globulus TaxID=34317 RepID=A0ABD3KKP1_EUCGL